MDNAIPRIALVVTSLAERVAEPFESFVETVSRGSTSGLNVLANVLADGTLIRDEIIPKHVVGDYGDQACR